MTDTTEICMRADAGIPLDIPQPDYAYGLLSRRCWRLFVKEAAAQIIGAAGTKGKACGLR